LDSDEELVDIAIQYQEVLKAGQIEFLPIVKEISNLDEFFGHKEIDARGDLVATSENSKLKKGYENDFVLINTKKMSLKP
jgi:hypothetical protein